MTSTNTYDAPLTDSMPVPMALDSKHVTAKPAAVPGQKKDLDYFTRKVTKAIIVQYRSTKALGDVFIEARMALSPEDFQKLVKESQISYSFFCKIMKQASDYKLNDPANDPILPEAFSSRHEIMLMKDSTFRIGVQQGIIHPNCTLADLKKLREQMETPKRKKATAKAKAKGKDSTAAAAKDEEPKKAAVKAPVNNTGLRLAADTAAAESANTGTTATATAPATATTTAMGRIAIVVSQGVLDQHKADLDRLMASIEALVKDYDFIGGVEMEVA